MSNSHKWQMQVHNFWVPTPLGPLGGTKRSNIIKSQLLCQFHIFLNQTFCVYSQMKDIKHVRRNLHSAFWVMPQGLDLGGYRKGVGVNFFSQNSTRVDA